MNQRIVEAIRNKNLIQFEYDGGLRIVEPHCYGTTTAGNEGLRAYQIGGYSSSGTMGWKMFDLRNTSSVTVLNDTFNNARDGYKKGDKGMSRIFEEI